MADETESLRLVVTLDDQASAQLGALRTNLGGLSDMVNRAGNNLGAGSQFHRKTAEATAGLKGLEATLASGSARLFGFGAAAGAVGGVVGVAATKMVEGIGEVINKLTDLESYAKKMTALQNLKLTTGFNVSDIEGATAAFERAGVSAEQAQSQFSGLAGVMRDLQKNYSAVRQSIIERTPIAQREEMGSFLRELGQSKNLIEGINLARQKYQQILAGSGAVSAGRFVGQLQAPSIAVLERDIKPKTAEEERVSKQRAADAKAYNAIVTETRQEFEDTLKAVQSIGTLSNSPFLNAWKAVGNSLQMAHTAADAIAGAFSKLNALLDKYPQLLFLLPGGNLLGSLKGMGKGFGDAPAAGDPGSGTFRSRLGKFDEGTRAIIGGPQDVKRLNPYGASTILGGDTPQRFVDAMGTGPFSPNTGGLNDFLSDSPESENVEDRRALDENSSETERLTNEMRKLNDYLGLSTRPLGLLDTKMGGLPGNRGAGGGMGNLPGFGGGGGGGGYRGGGGSGTPGTGGGGTPGTPSDGSSGVLGTPSGTGALWAPGGSGKSLESLRWPGGDAVTASPSTADQFKWPGSPIGGGTTGTPGTPGGTTRATWFHTGDPIVTPGGTWDDPSGRREGPPASGQGHNVPGIATPGSGGLNDWFKVSTPDGRTAYVQKTDIGPGSGPQSRGVGADINAALASQLYPKGPNSFQERGWGIERVGPKLPEGISPGIQSGGVNSAYTPGTTTAGGPFTVPFRTANNKDVEKYVGFERAIANMDPEFKARVQAAYNDMPPEIKKSFVINEGWRSYEQQSEYYRRYKSGQGGIAAPPGHSRHEGGGAVDVDESPAREWLRKNQHKYGIEDLGAKDMPHFQINRRDTRRFYNPDSSPTANTRTSGAVSYLDNPFAQGGGSGGDTSDESRELDMAAGKNFGKGGRELDRAAGKGRVHGTGKIEVDFKNMPDGVQGKAEGGGLFKDTAVTTQRQMAPASRGETKSANASMEE